LASVQVSLALVGRIHGVVDSQTALLAQLLVALLAIFAGFVLTNAIRRYNTLQLCCAAFYGKVVGADDGRLSEDARLAALDCLDELVLTSGDPLRVASADAEAMASVSFATPLPDALRETPALRRVVGAWRSHEVPPISLEARKLFPEEWAKVDVALAGRVSLYEWLVLLLGGSGLILASQFYAINSHSAVTIIIRAFTVAVTAGVVFAIRDYDKHRPVHIARTLAALRSGFNIEISRESPLGRASEGGGRARLGRWEVVGLSVLIGAALLAIALNLAG